MIDSNLYLDKTKTVMFGMFKEESAFLETTRKIHNKGVEIIDCYTPYPVHGIEKAMGLVRSRLPIGAFICGSTGFLCAFALQFYTMAEDWPMIIGNKPSIGVSWVPVLFELSVLFTAFGLAILFFTRSKMIHGKIPKELVTLQQTEDQMVIAINTDNPAVDKEKVKAMLFEGGAIKVVERENQGYELFSDREFLSASGPIAAPAH
jgi:hypothetical protein